MKNSIFALSLLFIIFSSCTKEKIKDTVKPTKEVKEVVKKQETTKQVVVWKGYKPTGSHTGTINVKSSNFKFEGDQLIGGTVVLDMTSIKNRDLQDAGDKSDLENHLKSTDFFNVAMFPTAKFEILKVETDKEGQFKIEGNLTIKDITKKISFTATKIQKDGKNYLKSGIIKIDRTDFGVKYKSKKFFANLKDKFINDEFDIVFRLVLK